MGESRRGSFAGADEISEAVCRQMSLIIIGKKRQKKKKADSREKRRGRGEGVWALGNIGHCSSDMSSLGPEGSPRRAKVSPSLTKGRMQEAGSCLRPKEPLTCRSLARLWQAHLCASPVQPSSPSCLQALVHPSYSVGLHGPYPQLPPTASLCSEAINSSHSISIDLSLSPSFFLLPSSIDPPAPLLPSLRLLHTDKFLLPALMHRTCSK